MGWYRVKMTVAEREIVIPYKPRSLQAHFHEQMKRWNLFVCHRRFGKTVMVINQLVKDALSSTKTEPRFAYIAPFYSQAKQIAWDYLKHYSRPIPGVAFNEAELRADYPNGGRVRLYGADNPNNLRGIYLDGVGVDEYGQIKPNLFAEVIRPTLADRGGYAIITGTPNGPNEFFDLYEKIKHNPDWYVRVHKASETGIVPQEELDA
jgi:phage terminase large subunit-like protein